MGERGAVAWRDPSGSGWTLQGYAAGGWVTSGFALEHNELPSIDRLEWCLFCLASSITFSPGDLRGLWKMGGVRHEGSSLFAGPDPQRPHGSRCRLDGKGGHFEN